MAHYCYPIDGGYAESKNRFDADPNPYKRWRHTAVTETYYFVWEAYNLNTDEAWDLANKLRRRLSKYWYYIPPFEGCGNAQEWVNKFMNEAECRFQSKNK